MHLFYYDNDKQYTTMVLRRYYDDTAYCVIFDMTCYILCLWGDDI